MTGMGRSGSAVRAAVAAGAMLLGQMTTILPMIALPTAASARQAVVAPSVVWPDGAGIARRGANGLSIDRGVASTPESADYVLTALTVSPDGIIRFTYAETAAPEAEAAGACDFTVRRVERALDQAQANDLAQRLAAIEMRALRDSRRGLELVGEIETRGGVVRHHVQSFVQTQGETRVRGVGKTWIFVRDGKAYYVHKRCQTPGGEAMLTELDQRIGLDYRRDPTPGELAPPASAPAPVTP